MLSEPKSIRIKFIKVGRLKFISHLDLARTFKTALIRAGIPIWYTCGFNPHPKLVFATTVSVGSESVCEYLDIKLNEEMSCEEVGRRLIAALTDELTVLDVYEPEHPFSKIAWSTYTVCFYDLSDPDAVERTLDGPMVVRKHSKSGEKEVDIRPALRSYTLRREESGLVMDVTLAASGENFVNPEYLAAALGSEDHDIMRTDVLFADGSSFR